jgi:NAD(P)-dependent dehydrogenase (short-subunit alcohol dehydrogenase family)
VLVNLTKTLSQEFGPKGIRVNAVSPGPVSTELWLGDHGVAQTVAQATGVDVDTARETVVALHRRFRHGPLHDARGGGHAHSDAGLRPHGQRDRRKLPDRRRLIKTT